MTEIGFNTMIGKLKSFYGEKYFHPYRVQKIADKFKYVSDEDFEKICEDIMARSNSAPTLETFIEKGGAALDRARKDWEARQLATLEKLPKCPYCHGTGYEDHLIKRGNGREYWTCFGCRDVNCMASKIKMRTTILRWQPEWEGLVFE